MYIILHYCYILINLYLTSTNLPSSRYMMFSCVLGVYNVPLFKQIKPKPCNTSIVGVMCNSALILIISSALPLQSRILGLFYYIIELFCYLIYYSILNNPIYIFKPIKISLQNILAILIPYSNTTLNVIQV